MFAGRVRAFGLMSVRFSTRGLAEHSQHYHAPGMFGRVAANAEKAHLSGFIISSAHALLKPYNVGHGMLSQGLVHEKRGNYGIVW